MVIIKQNDIKKNVIKWVGEEDYIECTFRERKYIKKVLRLASRHHELVPMLKYNRDGSVYCHISLKAVKLDIMTSRASGVLGKMIHWGEV